MKNTKPRDNHERSRQTPCPTFYLMTGEQDDASCGALTGLPQPPPVLTSGCRLGLPRRHERGKTPKRVDKVTTVTNPVPVSATRAGATVGILGTRVLITACGPPKVGPSAGAPRRTAHDGRQFTEEAPHRGTFEAVAPQQARGARPSAAQVRAVEKSHNSLHRVPG